MIPITTLSSDCTNTKILDMSKNIFEDDSKNIYSVEKTNILNEYDKNYDLDDSNKVLRNLLNLNINLDKIISCKKNEIDIKKKKTGENSEILKKLNSEIDEQSKLKLQRNSKVKITEQKNSNIDVYYIVYIIFISLLLIIQSSIVLFK
jgi:hypothetical protein